MCGVTLPPTRAVCTRIRASRLYKFNASSLVPSSRFSDHSQQGVFGRSAGRYGYATVHNDNAAGLWERPHGASPPTESGPRETARVHPISPRTSATQSPTIPKTAWYAGQFEDSSNVTYQTPGDAIQSALKSHSNANTWMELAEGKPDESSKSATPLAAEVRSSKDTKNGADEPIQLINFDYVKRNYALPTLEAYPNGLSELFDPIRYSLAIHNLCVRAGKTLRIEVLYGEKKGLRKEDLRRLGTENCVKTCTVKVDIADIGRESGVGEARNRNDARRAAWALIVSKMHVQGTLQKLIAPTAHSVGSGTLETTDTVGTSIASSNEEVLDVEQGSELETEDFAPLDEETLALEQDAAFDIYNYAARYGMVPSFTTETVPSRTPRDEFEKVPAELFKVTIKLPELNLEARAARRDSKSAETMAAVAFKRRAEKRHHEAAASVPMPAMWDILNTDTAPLFLQFFKDRVGGLDLQMQHEISQKHETVNIARLTINGKPVGQEARMTSKSKAYKIAYLTAAVEFASTNQQLLQDFVQSLNKAGRKTESKAPRPLNPGNLNPGSQALQMMRDALVEARKSGLPDARPDLLSDSPALEDQKSKTFRSLSPAAHKTVSAQLLSTQKRRNQNVSRETFHSARASLPVNVHRREVLEMVENNQYSIVIGHTGSGKTTQVPQILFENRVQKHVGSSCNIVCTQPRRIAAVSVAQRVAAERHEDLRQTVGYHVRLDAQTPRHSHGITYCTTGVLLQRLIHQKDAVLDGISHIIIDEVHERELAIDFLLIALKRAIEQRQASGLHVPKVVLMSATIDPEQFAEYLGQTDDTGVLQPCPTLTIPGRTFPIGRKYLGSIMHEMLSTKAPELKALLDADRDSRSFLDQETKFSADQAPASASRQASKEIPVIDWKRKPMVHPQSDEDAGTSSAVLEDTPFPLALVAATIAHICTTSHDGAILTFLSGLDEISAVKEFLREQNPFSIDFTDEGRYKICLLHSAIPKEQQAEVFQPCPPGRRKIILSTNIAETSVTVSDVKYVVDAGKLRESRYDQERRITSLQRVWASKPSLKQRAGRAGRVQAGQYYGLFSKERADSLRSVALPELLRSDLQGTCLAVRAHNIVGEDINAFLSEAVEPPARQAVDTAVRDLIARGALTANQELTALGRLLSKLPVHPALAKMIVLGMIFKCLDPMIILGAAAEDRPLFLRPIGRRKEAEAAHALYGEDSRSDHIAILKAFKDLRQIREEFGIDAAKARAQERFLHRGAFITIDQTARQIEGILKESNLVAKGPLQTHTYGSTELNQNSDNYDLIRCLLLAGVHPSLAAKEKDTGRTYRTRAESAVLLHPASLNAAPGSQKRVPAGTLFAFSTLNQSKSNQCLFMRNSTHVTPLMAALFGGELRTTEAGRLELDEWLPFTVKGEGREVSARVILEFRKALDRVLNGAFNSLSSVGEDGSSGLIDDPVREKFVGRVVQLLRDASSLDYAISWPSDAAPGES